MKRRLILWGMRAGALSLISLIVIHSLEAKRVYITIDKAKLKKSILAIPPFQNVQNDLLASDIGNDLRKVIYHDLDFSGLFDFIVLKETRPFEGGGYRLKDINFKEWGALGTEFLIKGGFKLDLDEIIFEVVLYDVKSAKAITGKKYRAHRDDVRALSHRFSDEVMKALTGKDGIFQTKILFVSDKTRNKELYVMDYDGHHIEQLTHHKSIVLSPEWSQDGKKVVYSSYETHKRHVINLDLSLMDLDSKDRKILSRRPGLNTGASWSPDGYEIAVTMSFEGNPEIYTILPNGNLGRRVTDHAAIDVESDWSPDGSRIVFSSGRAPFAHLYVMKKEGTDIQRLTFAGRYNSAPSWSPNGDQIVFAGQKEGAFDLYMIQPDGQGLKRLTKSEGNRHNEAPSFSADGRHIVFSSNRSGKYELYIINEDGSNERPLLKNFGNCLSPKWSPYLD